MPLRLVRDLDLAEVSLLDRTKIPAYDGTLVCVRSDESSMFYGETFEDEMNIREERAEEPIKEEPNQAEPVKEINYAEWESLIADMKN